MENKVFSLELDKEKGGIGCLSLLGDESGMSFIAEGHALGEIAPVPVHTFENGVCDVGEEGAKLEATTETETDGAWESTFHGVRFLGSVRFEGENIVVRHTVRNENAYPVYFKNGDFSVYAPFADRYEGAEVCFRKRCHVHVYAGRERAWVKTERMGESEYAVGLYVREGDIVSYSQEKVNINNRGYFLLNTAAFQLLAGGEYVLEYVIFAHKGGEDFFRALGAFEGAVTVKNDGGYTLFKGEKRKVELAFNGKIESAAVYENGKPLAFVQKEGGISFTVKAKAYGEKTVIYEINGKKGVLSFFVSRTLSELIKQRVFRICSEHQCLEKGSPLYGAFLIYDNEEKTQFFDFEYADHNACRERMGMALLLTKYLQNNRNDTKARKSLKLFADFLLRECVDEETGIVYNNIGKDASVVRLYNAPWVALFFSEMHRLTGEGRYGRLVCRLMTHYYKNGGTRFYPNGICFLDIERAVRESVSKEEHQALLTLFDEHIETLLKNGTSYPPHEVNYEQTIVTPAVRLLLDKYALSGDKKYLEEAGKHIRLLKKFDGAQPDHRQDKLPIRYWDAFWFGKTGRRTGGATYGDTLHYWSVLSGESYIRFARASGDEALALYGQQTVENCYALFKENGEASCAYVYPAFVNGKRGAYYDPFANDQDFTLYFALRLGL